MGARNAVQVPINQGSAVGAPFCDYLRVSMEPAAADEVEGALRPLLEHAGCVANPAAPGEYLHHGGGGSFKRLKPGRVDVLSLSGSLLADLRAGGVLNPTLAVLGTVPHRVTRLDAARDYGLPGPLYVAEIHRLALAGRIRLTYLAGSPGMRRLITPEQVSVHLSADVRGAQTGTVNLGRRGSADVIACVYDKRHERLCRGFPDPGELLRVEMRLGKSVGMTLRDASSPERLFYHYAAPDLCSMPPAMEPWLAHAEGLVLQPIPQFTADERLARLVERSGELGRILELALATDATLGSLFALLRRRARQLINAAALRAVA